MTTGVTPQAPAPGAPRRKRHRLRWTLVGIIAFLVVVVVVAVIAVKPRPAPAPLALPSSAAAAPSGPLDGTWRATSGSVAGFRVQQTAIGMTSDVVGRTKDITGTVVIADGSATTADLRINLLALTYGGKPAPQFQTSLDTSQHPDSTVGLARPVALGGALASGAATTVTAAGRLTLHGVTHTVTVPLTVRRDGANMEVAGSIPVKFADWGIVKPKGYGFLGSLADHGLAEFLLVLHRD